MQQLLAIIWKELYVRFTDRSLILIMLVTPMTIATIIALALGGVSSGDVPIRDIPVAILNQDQGGDFGINYGELYATVLIPDSLAASEEEGDEQPKCLLTESGQSGESNESDSNLTLDELTEAIIFDEAEAHRLLDEELLESLDLSAADPAYLETMMRAAVDSGIYTAAIIIPSDFTERISYMPMIHPEIEEAEVTVYANAGQPISASIIRSIAEGITNQIATSNIASAAIFDELEAQGGLAAVGMAATEVDLAALFACSFAPEVTSLTLDVQGVSAGETQNLSLIILVTIGSAQAMFFGLFTAQFGVLSMHDERRNWTLQRLLISPVPKITILTGKLAGVFVSVIFQVSVLGVALTLIGSLMVGEFVSIWGNDIPAILLVLVATSIAMAGIGMLLVGLIKTPEQAQTFGPAINIGLAILGGGFGFQLPDSISQVSIIYWGREAFERLAFGQGDIGLHVAVLVIQGVIAYIIGLALFSRSFEL